MKPNPSSRVHPRPPAETLITAVAVGSVFIIIGAVFVFTPDLSGKIVNFFQDMNTTAPFPFLGTSNSTISLPAPAHPDAHTILYNAVMQFDIGIGILQVAILAVRLYVRSPRKKIAETVDHTVFWLGAAVLVSVFLLAGTTTAWFAYWAALIALIGVSMVTRAVVLFVTRRKG